MKLYVITITSSVFIKFLFIFQFFVIIIPTSTFPYIIFTSKEPLPSIFCTTILKRFIIINITIIINYFNFIFIIILVITKVTKNIIIPINAIILHYIYHFTKLNYY